jgi:uncharacterized repeat protein (TIGR01451 family)
MPGLSTFALGLALALATAGGAAAESLVPFGPFVDELEPNDNIPNNQPLGTPPARVRGLLHRTPYVAPNADVDIYSFLAAPGARVFAATMTASSAGAQDTVIDILDTNGTTILESDNDDGSFGGQSSAIGGVFLTNGGTYYVRVRQGATATLGDSIRPYDLYVNVVNNAPVAEVEPNGTSATATSIDAAEWASGTIGAAGDQDWYSFTAEAGDTIVAILDADPERDTPDWDPKMAMGIFNGVMTTIDSAGDSAPAEAWIITARSAGTYFVRVEDVLGTGGAAFTYRLAVFVTRPKTRPGCLTYSGTGGPIPDLATTDFTVNVPDQQLVDYVKLGLTATHSRLTDLDVTLAAPGGNEVALFDNLAGATGALPFDLVLEDEGGLPVSAVNVYNGVHAAPEAGARFEHFRGMPSQGNWTLRFRDDAATNSGTVLSWSLTVCGATRPACVIPGPIEATVYSSDFEGGDGGFLHSGTLDEWERGTPSAAPLQTAHSGTQAWSIDLDNTYENLSSQNLVSPPINLAGLTGRITLDWWQEFSLDNAGSDSYWVEVRPVGGGIGRRVFTWTGGNMARTMGSPPVSVLESAGWARMRADISSLAGQNVEAVFHLDSDAVVALAGVSIDDVAVTRCDFVFGQPVSNVAITNTDNQFTYYPGEVKTYTIVVNNLGPQPVIGAAVVDTFPPELTGATWTCQASAGSSCGAPSGTGDINTTVNLLFNGSAAFIATVTVAANATGQLSNTATISVPPGWNDSDPVNNSFTDIDTLRATAPQALVVDASPGNGVFQPGETVPMAPTWRNIGPAAGAFFGVMSNHTGPTGPIYGINDGVADYGSIPAGGTASCTVTSNCYLVSASDSTRPATHWDSTVDENIGPASSVTKTWRLHIGDSFSDVPPTNGFYKFIETLLHRAVTGGCTATTYCPGNPTTRNQMAVFALVSKEGSTYLPPACVAGAETFADVPATNPFCRWIEELFRRAVVGGCGGGNYCPSSPVTREQMAIFMLLTLDPTMTPPACAPPNLYLDVPETSPYCRWIEELTVRGVVSGCGGGNYCPTAPVTREQMGVFLGVTFGLTLYGVS